MMRAMNAAHRATPRALPLADQGAKDIFSHRKYWAARFGTAPFLPMSRAEMEALLDTYKAALGLG